MTRKFSKVISAALALSMVISLSACGGAAEKAVDSQASNATAAVTTASTGEKVTLNVYAQYADEDTKLPWDYAVAALKEVMPNVELKLDIQAQDDGQKIRSYAATGNMPDIYETKLAQINTFKASKNILQLDEYVNKLGFKDKMQASATNTLVAPDGNIWAFPFSGNELVLLYYNTELFKQNGVKVPTTYDELMTATKTFTSKSIIPLSIFAKEKWPCVALYDVFATRMDAEGIKKLDEGRGKASEAAYKNAAQEVIDLVNAGFVSKSCTNTNYDQASALFYQGKAAMFISGQWEIDSSTKNLGDKVDWMAYPAPDAATYEKGINAFSGGGGVGGFAVSPNTKDKDLTTKVASILALKYAECKYTTRGNPIVATKVDAPIKKEFPAMMKKLADVIPNITSTTAFDWGLSNPKFQTSLEDATQKLLTGAYSADAFATDMDKAIEEANKK